MNSKITMGKKTHELAVTTDEKILIFINEFYFLNGSDYDSDYFDIHLYKYTDETKEEHIDALLKIILSLNKFKNEFIDIKKIREILSKVIFEYYEKDYEYLASILEKEVVYKDYYYEDEEDKDYHNSNKKLSQIEDSFTDHLVTNSQTDILFHFFHDYDIHNFYHQHFYYYANYRASKNISLQ